MVPRFLRRYRLSIGVAAAMLVVLTIVFVSYRNTRASLDASRMVAHTHEVISALQKTLALVEASEAAQRRYVITGSRTDSLRARAEWPLIRGQLNSLRSMIRHDPGQTARLGDLERAIARKLRYIDKVIDLRDRQGFDAAREFVLTGEGLVAMRAVERSIDEMCGVENGLLAGRTELSEKEARWTVFVLAAGTMFDLGLVAAIWALLIRDLHRRNDLQRALAIARDAALNSAEVRSLFLANMSHEIRTPMNAIIGMSRLLLDTELDDDQRELAGTVHTSAEALLSIINDVLDFSKIEAGKLLVEAVDFDIRKTVESVVDLIAEKAQRKHVEIGVLFDHELPAMLRGDAGRIRQVLTNLGTNAVKFTDSGGEVILHLSLVHADEKVVDVRFSVTDTGIGIPRDVMSGLFQPFTQADASTTRQYGGTGLGLAISKQLVEQMGGAISVDSAPGKGSTFSFTLPLLRAQSEQSPARAELEGLRVLVVDDNEMNRRVLLHNLAAWKMKSDEVSNGLQAVARLREAAASKEPFQIAILDMFMPEMDGVTLARLIKSDREISGTRLIMLTSLADRPAATVLRETGIDSALTKPVKQSALFDAIADAVGVPADAGRETQVRKPAAAAPIRADVRVLVAEDNPVNRTVTLKQLRKLGIVAEAVSNGAEVLDVLDRVPCDLVLMDCQMPVMDGIEATRRIRGGEVRGRRTPVVALTASALHGDRERCLETGMDDYLSKPVSESELLRVMERWLPAEEDPIDPATIRTLRELGTGDDFLTELIAVYAEDAPAQVKAIRDAVDAKDPVALANAAHAFKSSSGHIGAMKVRESCEVLEHIGRSGSMRGVAAEMIRLVRENERAMTRLRALQSDSEST
ncbi:MAG TPA: response regulator [Thermoanaerobaculia bacterium]|nr:response regulator [Thermoanaerobaculia bacterium]